MLSRDSGEGTAWPPDRPGLSAAGDPDPNHVYPCPGLRAGQFQVVCEPQRHRIRR